MEGREPSALRLYTPSNYILDKGLHRIFAGMDSYLCHFAVRRIKGGEVWGGR